MRRDLCYYYPCPKDMVFAAYLRTANQKFGKNCKQDPNGNSISFGLNFSFRYNMNGGACTIHFMPYRQGTAIDVRYSIVQAFGARYKRHASEMTMFADGLIGVKAQPIKMDINYFTNFEMTGIVPDAGAAHNLPQRSAPSVQQVPVQQMHAQQRPVQQMPTQQRPAQQMPIQRFDVSFRNCKHCGKRVPAETRICPGCGKPMADLSARQDICPKCGSIIRDGARFCIQCGQKNPFV